jgi:hypothetical protein
MSCWVGLISFFCAFGVHNKQPSEKNKAVLAGYLPVQFWSCPEPHLERFSPFLRVGIMFGFMAVNHKSK